jgi:hypothetical protein
MFRVDKLDVKTIFYVLYIGVITLGASYAIGFATKYNVLLWAALPLGAVIVALFLWLPPRVQLVGWAVATAWLLSSVYLGSSDIELVALVVVMVAAIAGVVWSPWFLAAIWFLHPVWDLIPRDLPDQMHDLPLACLIYDLVIAIYLAFRTRSGFFENAIASSKSRMLSTGWARTLVAIYLLAVVVIEIMAVGSLTMTDTAVWSSLLVGIAMIATLFWLPRDAQRVFWVAFTAWMGMNFAHSGDPIEILIFLVIVVLAVLGFTKNPYLWPVAWALHAFWYLAPREHNMQMAMLMGHWMQPIAGFLFELAIAVWLAFFAYRLRKANESLVSEN